jgi:hypothetical protein
MKKEKMTLEKMRSVLSNVLSRDEMKEVMAGSGGGTFCGRCNGGVPPDDFPEDCFTQSGGCVCPSGIATGCHT